MEKFQSKITLENIDASIDETIVLGKKGLADSEKKIAEAQVEIDRVKTLYAEGKRKDQELLSELKETSNKDPRAVELFERYFKNLELINEQQDEAILQIEHSLVKMKEGHESLAASLENLYATRLETMNRNVEEDEEDEDGPKPILN